MYTKKYPQPTCCYWESIELHRWTIFCDAYGRGKIYSITKQDSQLGHKQKIQREIGFNWENSFINSVNNIVRLKASDINVKSNN